MPPRWYQRDHLRLTLNVSNKRYSLLPCPLWPPGTPDSLGSRGLSPGEEELPEEEEEMGWNELSHGKSCKRGEPMGVQTATTPTHTDTHTQVRQRATHKDTHKNFSLHNFSPKISSLLRLTCFFQLILPPPPSTRFICFVNYNNTHHTFFYTHTHTQAHTHAQ